jgi:hypothetical protein
MKNAGGGRFKGARDVSIEAGRRKFTVDVLCDTAGLPFLNVAVACCLEESEPRRCEISHTQEKRGSIEHLMAVLDTAISHRSVFRCADQVRA